MTRAASPLRPPQEIPRPGALEVLRGILTGGGGRVDMLSRLQRQHDAHGTVVMLRLGAMRMVNLFGPDANRLVLLDRDRIFSARRPWHAIMGRIFPRGLLLRDGDDHKHHRKIMHLPFKRPALREYADRLNPMVEAALDGWAREGSRRLMFPSFKELTLDMAACLFVGVELGHATRRMNQAFEDMVAASMSRLRLRLPGLEFERGLRGREFMMRFLGDLVAQKRSGDGSDLFSRLCHAETEEGDRFADDEVIDHMIFLMMAAHDTTTSTLCSMTYELARHPVWQERVREESRALGQTELGFDDLERLPALGWAMQETLRRYPPLPVIPRVATEDFGFAGYRIPAGAMVVISPIHTHHMREWWPDPSRFDPERFAPQRAEHERHTHCWVPFGGGPHHCLGRRFAELQIKVVMHQILQRFRFEVPDGYRMPVQQAPISKPRDGLPVTLSAL